MNAAASPFFEWPSTRTSSTILRLAFRGEQHLCRWVVSPVGPFGQPLRLRVALGTRLLDTIAHAAMEVDTTPPPLASTAAVGNAGAGAAGGTGAAGSSSSATTNMRRAEAGGAGRASPPASSLALLPSRKRRRSSQTSVSLSSAMLRQQQQYDVGGSIPSLWNAGWREHSWEASTCATRAALTPAQEETTSYSNEDHSSLSGYGCYQLDDNETVGRWWYY